MSLTAITIGNAYVAQAESDAGAALRSEPAQQIPVVSNPFKSIDGGVEDKVTLSEIGRRQSKRGKDEVQGEAAQQQSAQKNGAKSQASSEQLSAEEQQSVQKLKQRDREVRTHEQAHLANAGQYAAGGPSYSYQTGPDGRRYAVGGEVPIDISKERTPEQTIQKMRVVQRAALAPANPSSADRNIAAAAGMKEAEAIREMNSTQAPPESNEPGQRSTDNSPVELSPENKPEHPVRRQDFQAIYA